MAKYKAFYTYTIDDEVEFEFDGGLAEAEEALWDGKIVVRHELSAINRRGHILPWDEIDFYEVVENED